MSGRQRKRCGPAFLGIAITICVAAANAASVSADTAKARRITKQELTGRKTGSVIDAETGAGLAGAKVIVNWRTSSSGIPGYSSTGGTWCDLQQIETTDAAGNFAISDVSKVLDISDQGTRTGPTAFGVASATHEKDYVLFVFKEGYVGARDWQVLQEFKTGARRNLLGWPSPPQVSFTPDHVAIRPIALKKIDLSPPELWGYYSFISSSGMCSDRMANNIEDREFSNIRATIKSAVLPTPCRMNPDSTIDPDAFKAFRYLSHGPNGDLTFYERVKALQGLPASERGYDPTERIAVSASALCKALTEEDATE